MTDKNLLGSAVARRRRELGLSQAQLAALSGVSRGTVRNLEVGMYDPNPATWRAVQAVLGWAAGAKELAEAGQDPPEVMPRDVLTMVLAELAELEFEGRDEYEPLKAQFRNLMSRVNRDGVFPQSVLTSIADFIYEFPWHEPTGLFEHDLTDASDEQVEAAQERVIERIQSAIRTVELRRTERSDNSRSSVGRPAASVRTRSDAASSSTDQGPWDQLSPGVRGLLEDGHIVDYGVYEPEESETIVVVALLVKKSTAPLGRGDRQYLSAAWNDFAGMLRADAVDDS